MMIAIMEMEMEMEMEMRRDETATTPSHAPTPLLTPPRTTTSKARGGTPIVPTGPWSGESYWDTSPPKPNCGTTSCREIGSCIAIWSTNCSFRRVLLLTRCSTTTKRTEANTTRPTTHLPSRRGRRPPARRHRRPTPPARRARRPVCYRRGCSRSGFGGRIPFSILRRTTTTTTTTMAMAAKAATAESEERTAPRRRGERVPCAR